MHHIYLLARIFPYWALPLALVLAQLGMFFRRRKSPMMYSCAFGVALLTAGVLAWFIFRGDLNSDHWVRAFFGE